MLAAYDPDDPALPASCDAGDTHVTSVISFFTVLPISRGLAHTPHPGVFDMRQRVTNYLGGSPAPQPARYPRRGPLPHVTPPSPPTLLIHGGSDATVPIENAPAHGAQPTAARVRHDKAVIPYGQHAFDFIFGGLGEQLAEQAILRFLRGER